MAADIGKFKMDPSTLSEIEFEMATKNQQLPSCEKTPSGDESDNNQIQELLQKMKVLPAHDPAVRNITSQVCTLLIKAQSYDKLGGFLKALPATPEFQCNEDIIRARVYVALYNGDTKTVYKLIEENQFSDGEDLIKLWDEARYLDEKNRTKKKLTPLSRFRVRKRYPPPRTICSNGMRKTNTLPREATSCLKYWLMSHLSDPYPSASEKQQLAKVSGLSHAQVKTWFANARRRSKTTEEFQRRCKSHWPMPVLEPPKQKKEVRCYAGFSGASSIASPPSSPLPLTYNNAYHPSHYMFGNEPLTHLENNQVGGVMCHEYFQTLTSGYNRNDRVDNYGYDHHSYPPCNNMKICRSSAEQSYYDENERIFYGGPPKSYHYYDDPHFHHQYQ